MGLKPRRWAFRWRTPRSLNAQKFCPRIPSCGQSGSKEFGHPDPAVERSGCQSSRRRRGTGGRPGGGSASSTVASSKGHPWQGSSCTSGMLRIEPCRLTQHHGWPTRQLYLTVYPTKAIPNYRSAGNELPHSRQWIDIHPDPSGRTHIRDAGRPGPIQPGSQIGAE